jgi:hypothetical protein
MKNTWQIEKQPPKYYFAYGMNTNIKGMADRCPDAVNLGKCVLDGFALKFRLHADIERDPDASMEGVLWEITERCEMALDMLEGYPYYYDKVELIVKPQQLVNGRLTHIRAMAYIMTNQVGLEAPGDVYSLCLREGYAENGLSTDLLEEAIQESAVYESR